MFERERAVSIRTLALALNATERKQQNHRNNLPGADDFAHLIKVARAKPTSLADAVSDHEAREIVERASLVLRGIQINNDHHFSSRHRRLARLRRSDQVMRSALENAFSGRSRRDAA